MIEKPRDLWLRFFYETPMGDGETYRAVGMHDDFCHGHDGAPGALMARIPVMFCRKYNVIGMTQHREIAAARKAVAKCIPIPGDLLWQRLLADRRARR